MQPRRSFSARLAVLVLALVAAAAPAGAAVNVYTSVAAFQADAPTATLVADMESKAIGSTGTFTLGGITISSPLGNMYIIGPTSPGATNPLPTVHWLSANGQEDFTVDVLATNAYAIGFNLLTNQFGPGTVTLYGNDDVEFFSHQPTQANNTTGFVGFVSTTPIGKMRWVAVRGNNQNTALDDFYLGLIEATPVASSTWGRVKALYR